jgi:hypothetical protein
VDEEERHLARHEREGDVVKTQGDIRTVQRDGDRTLPVLREHDLEDRS